MLQIEEVIKEIVGPFSLESDLAMTTMLQRPTKLCQNVSDSKPLSMWHVLPRTVHVSTGHVNSLCWEQTRHHTKTLLRVEDQVYLVRSQAI